MTDYNMSFSQYRALPGWNWSAIKALRRSPRACAYAAAGDDDGDTASRRWLRAIHAAALEGVRDYVVYDGVRRGRRYEDFVAENPGRDVLNVREASALDATVDGLLEHPVAGPLLRSATGRPEVTVQWHGDGIDQKGRVDWYDEGSCTLVDLKTLGDVDPRHVERTVAREAYHGQLAHYAAGLRACGLPVERVLLIVAQGAREQDVGVYELDGRPPHGALYVGEQLREELLEQLRECIDRDAWPGAVPAVESLCLPDWAMPEPLIIGGGAA